MRILIERCGSGWGGSTGRWLHDTEQKVKVDLSNCYYITNDKKYFGIDVLRMELSDFPKVSVHPCNYDLSLLESFLPDYELTNPDYVMMDQQVDIVHILLDDGSIRCVYDTSMTDIKPANPALRAKLELLIDPSSQWRH